MIHFESLELRNGVNDETQPVPLTFDPSLPGHALHGARRVRRCAWCTYERLLKEKAQNQLQILHCCFRHKIS